jgi:hypothetical protein
MVRDQGEGEAGLLGGARVLHEVWRRMLLTRERVPDLDHRFWPS